MVLLGLNFLLFSTKTTDFTLAYMCGIIVAWKSMLGDQEIQVQYKEGIMINRSRRRNIVFTFGILFLLVAMLMSSGCGTIKKTNSGSESEGEDQSMYNDETTGTVTSPEVNQYGVLYSTTDKRGIINSISELNTKTEKLDSHAGEMANSYIKFNYRETEEIAPGNIGGTPYYPRVKTMANGKYLMTYQNAQSKDGSVFYRISSDL